MKKNPERIPKYRRQNRPDSADAAFVELNGLRHYLGPYDSAESREAYHRLLAEWTASRGQLPTGRSEIAISELIIRFYRHAQAHYRRPDGSPTSEIANFKLALRPLRKLYGRSRVSDFGPRSLKAVRQEMIDRGWSRRYINHHIGRIKRMFKWAVAEELVDPSVCHGLQAVEGLALGRTDAPEGPGVKPVPGAYVEAIRPHVSRQVWALIELQRLTAARPGELVIMRPIDIDMMGRVWTYNPQTHKNSYRSQQRTIYMGPRAQEVVGPFLSGRPVEAFMFSPAEAEVERRAAIHASRETPLSCGNRPGTNCKRRPSKQPGDCYTTDSYRRAIIYGCDRAFPPPDDIRDDPAVVKQWRKEHRWHPHQLRHSAATMIRKEFGLEAAQLLLGHVHADVTQVYAEVNHTKALEVAEKIG